MSDNPYESPQAEASTENPLSGRVLTEKMLFYLRGASPWLRFVGITGFVFLGLAVIGLLTAIIGSNFLPSIPGIGSLSPFIFVAYLPFLVIPFFLVFFVFQFGRKIQVYLQTGDYADLEDAFKNNKSLWTLMGVLYIISLAGFALMLIGGIIAAIFAASQF
ncbi:MAG: hypothetical protein LBB72_06745 [Spirochaetaceae bacterium]|jgi:hypothetical protein|nr:hypothetical protein [Spirochaetaceae bacterium]